MGVALNHKYTLAYILLIPLVGWLFVNLPLISFPDGSQLSPAAFVVGFVFVVRDFAQREIGHKVIFAMLLASGLTFILADPAIAIAGTVAFLASEGVDWLVYTFSNLSLPDRILLSSVAAVPVDSLVVLYGLTYTFAGVFTFGNFLVLTTVKILAACLLVLFIKTKRP